MHYFWGMSQKNTSELAVGMPESDRLPYRLAWIDAGIMPCSLACGEVLPYARGPLQGHFPGRHSIEFL
jgi:hypothetical protein